MKIRPKSRTDKVVVQKMNKEVLVYDVDLNKAVCLNETAAIVWKLCDGERTASEIAEEVSRQLKKPVTDELVWLAIDQLKRENLLSNGYVLEGRFDGLTRREVVRKVGITSMVALPIVSSILAPEALNAQSACMPSSGDPGLGDPCECGIGTPIGTDCGAGLMGSPLICIPGCLCIANAPFNFVTPGICG